MQEHEKSKKLFTVSNDLVGMYKTQNGLPNLLI